MWKVGNEITVTVTEMDGKNQIPFSDLVTELAEIEKLGTVESYSLMCSPRGSKYFKIKLESTEEEDINVQLSKEDMINLVKGIGPHFSAFTNGYILGKGDYFDNSGWSWDEHKLRECTITDLWIIYLTCKDSWEKK